MHIPASYGHFMACCIFFSSPVHLSAMIDIFLPILIPLSAAFPRASCSTGEIRRRYPTRAGASILRIVA